MEDAAGGGMGSMQGLSDGLGASLQGSSDRLLALFDSAGQVFSAPSPSSDAGDSTSGSSWSSSESGGDSGGGGGGGARGYE